MYSTYKMKNKSKIINQIENVRKINNNDKKISRLISNLSKTN